MGTSTAVDAFATLVSGSITSNVSNLLTKVTSHIKDISPSLALQHLQKDFLHTSDMSDAKPGTLEKRGSAPGSPLPKILSTPSKRSTAMVPQGTEVATNERLCLTNAVLASLFVLYKYPATPDVMTAKRALSTMKTLTLLTTVSADSYSVFLLAQAIHLLLVDITNIHIAKATTASSESGHSKLQLDAEYESIEGGIVSSLRIFSSKANHDEVIIVLLNALLRLQLLTFNYLSAYRSILNYRVVVFNVSHPQLVRFYFYSALIVAIIGQHARALKLISNANQLFADYSPAIATKTQISVDLAAFTALFKMLTCTDSSSPQSSEDHCEEMVHRVSFPDIYRVLLLKRMARIKTQLAYIGRIFKRISLSEVCHRINVSESEAKDYLISCAMENAFIVRFSDDEDGNCIVTIVQQQEQLLSSKSSFRTEALQLVGRLSSIRHDLTQKDVLLSRTSEKRDKVNNPETYLDMLDLLDLGFSDTD